ncbi:hypothetical protein ACO0LD_31610 [Undibacterium sp. Ji83W]|uniref:hypothetical protein n=1 Tax=Undibacterium sp. Ji83W TaxID=3413043 RepID=UPI003BF205D6
MKKIKTFTVIVASLFAFNSLAQNNGIVEKFEKKYPQIKGMKSSQIPFQLISDEKAEIVLRSSNVYFPFGQTPPLNGAPYFQLYSSMCFETQSKNGTCLYLVVFEGFANASTKVFGPVNLEDGSSNLH